MREQWTVTSVDKCRTSISRLLIALAFALLRAPLASAEDSERIKELEKRLHELSRDVEALKSGATPSQATPSGAELAVPAAKDDSGAQALEESARNKERIDALEQRVNQTGVEVRFGEGIVFEDPKGNWSVRLGGRVQLDYRNFSPGGTIADTFSLRRVRAGVDATFYKDYRIVVEGEYANGNATGTATQNVALTLGYFDIVSFGPGARIRLGQFKPAFGYEQTIQDLYSDYMERSLAQSLLQNLNYDRGVMLYGSPLSGFWYGVTVSNGVGQNLEEKQANRQEVDTDKPELTARLTENFASLFALEDKIVQLGASYKDGRVANSSANPYSAASVQTEGRGAVFFTPAPFNAAGAAASNIERVFRAYEYLFAWGPVKLQGESVAVNYAGTANLGTAPVAFNRKLEADYIALMWLVTGEKYADFFRDSTIGKIRPRNRFAPGKEGGWGALELGVRYSTFNGKEFSNSNPANSGRLGTTSPVTTSTNEAQGTTLQVKWIPNVYTRFWMDWINTRFATPIVVNGKSETKERALSVRAQIDF